MADEERERDEDRELFARALEASAPAVDVPAGFAEETAAAATAAMAGSGARRARPRTWGLALIAAAAMVWIGVRLFVPANTSVFVEEDEISVSDTATAPVSASLGRRATVVLEPGSELSYAIGGWFNGDGDVVRLERGSAFFRVEGGGAFEVRTPAGNVRVTGTCFQVVLRGDDEREQAMATQERGKGRFRWFGAGAMSAALVVVVYEGGVRVANADGGGEIAVVAGEAATVSDQGEVTQIDGAPAFVAATDPATATATATATDPATATATDPATATAAGPADVLALRNEVGRLRGLLERNAISPETGAPAGPGERRRGLNDDGDTDLTEDEWRALAERGELRYRIPGNAQGAIRPPVVQAHRLTGDEVTRLSTIVRDAHERLHREMSLLFREAVGSDPQGMSMSAMMMEIGDKTEEQAASRIRWVLSQERAGLMAPPTVTPDMLPYERMIRLLVAFEGELEAALAAVVGPETAHSIVHGENAMPAHAYGAVGRRNGG